MGFPIQFEVLLENCSDGPEADRELDALADYVGERMQDGVDPELMLQALAECLYGLNDSPMMGGETIH
tara:strand:+ start:909 stop:1112 length:204 start_codon:yes stop_codon:yes gene_type:complete